MLLLLLNSCDCINNFYTIIGGLVWEPTNAPYGDWRAVVSDSTGMHLAAGQNGYIYLSATGTLRLLSLMLV